MSINRKAFKAIGLSLFEDIPKEGYEGKWKMGKKTKTSIHIDEDLWEEFSIAVIRKEGLRKKNAVLEKLIKQYIDTNK